MNWTPVKKKIIINDPNVFMAIYHFLHVFIITLGLFIKLYISLMFVSAFSFQDMVKTFTPAQYVFDAFHIVENIRWIRLNFDIVAVTVAANCSAF
jgi:hypothetical protein